MFSALKRIASQKFESGLTNTPSQIPMSQNLQHKFSKGIQYNMKIIIKGDRNTGKTCLFERLQGKKFVPEYNPTEQIQVANIHWNYEESNDVVKVEVWDVVDKAKKRSVIEGLKLTSELQPALDAEFLDVYKQTHGVILMMDLTKKWTFNYVIEEMERIPDHIPVVLVGNHCDMSHHRVVTQEVISYFIESLQRAKPNSIIRYTEASMSNGFGLKYLHKFFTLPFLHLQRDTLIGQLQTNGKAITSTIHQLDQHQRESDYNLFLASLSRKRREIADSSGATTPGVIRFAANVRQPSIIVGQGKPIKVGMKTCAVKENTQSNYINPICTPKTISECGKDNKEMIKITSMEFPEESSSVMKVPPDRDIHSCLDLNSNVCDRKPTKKPSSSSIDETLNKSLKPDFDKTSPSNIQSQFKVTCDKNLTEKLTIIPSEVTLDEFIPDEGNIDSSFLEGVSTINISSVHEKPTNDVSDSDHELSKNPMVTRYEEDIDSEDTQEFNNNSSKISESFKNSDIERRSRKSERKNDCLGNRENLESLQDHELDTFQSLRKKKEKSKNQRHKLKTNKEQEVLLSNDIPVSEVQVSKLEEAEQDIVFKVEKKKKRRKSD